MRMILAVGLLATSVGSHAPDVSRVETYYPDGRPMNIEHFVDGRKAGLQETWWPNGHRRTIANYRDDVYQGEYRSWRQDGSPYELRHYDRGRESGLQQSWEADGKLYLNYEVRDGRRYGFINSKPCLPASNAGPK